MSSMTASIGDYVTFAPGVRCNGNVHIGDHAYVGAGAIIRQGKPGEPLRIGAGRGGRHGRGSDPRRPRGRHRRRQPGAAAGTLGGSF